MRIIALTLFVALLTPIIAFSQELNFIIMDSLNYIPRNISVGDYNNDGLDEIFVATNSQILVIDPRTHSTLASIDSLYNINTISFQDVNGDGTKDFYGYAFNLLHFYNLLQIIYGPNFQTRFECSIDDDHAIAYSFDGIAPDHQKIIAGSDMLYSWDAGNCTASVISGGKVDKIDDLVSKITDYHYSNGPYTAYDSVKASFLNSYLDSYATFNVLRAYSDINFPSDIHLYGTAEGYFWYSGQGKFVVVAYSASTKLKFICVDNQYNQIYSTVDNSTIDSGCINQYIFSCNQNGDNFDELYLFELCPTHINIKLYNGFTFIRTQQIVINVTGTTSMNRASIYDSLKYDFVLKAPNKIYIGRLGSAPISINEDSGPLPYNLSISAYPNPFNSEVMLSLSGVRGMPISIGIYDITGRLVRSIHATTGEIIWDGTSDRGETASSGVYLIRALALQKTAITKVVLLR
jgi:hypothetical protein